jgi:type IV secretory pathway TraG/TraD family ATPase VirD4
VTVRRAVALGLAAALFALPWPWGPVIGLGLLSARVTMAVRRRHGLARRRGLPWRRRAAPGAVALGRDGSGRAVGLTDEQLGAHALIVGASGAGKTTTLQAILADRITRGHPVVALDMKGSPSFAATLAAAAHAAGRPLSVWTPQGPTHWNPLAHGSPTALKDKLISAERFSEPHYRRAAERYLQTALQVLDATRPGRAPALAEVVAAMEPGRLRVLARGAPAPLAQRVEGYLAGLTPDQESAARGLATRLALLAESDAGAWLAPAGEATAGSEIDLGSALCDAGGPVVLFSINSSVYGALGAQLGALVVQDVTSAAGRRLQSSTVRARPATVALDEFSALGADNVLSLLARGREAGVGVLLATQELTDLERAGRGFRDQVLGITAVTLAHRQEVHESALAVSRMAGTKLEWRQTRPRGGLLGRSALRVTEREHEEPVVHPNTIKRLPTGQVVLVTHVPRPTVARVRIDPAAPSRGRRGARRDQPPGVTR